MLRRPTAVRIDESRCIRCGVCEQIIPDILLDLGDSAKPKPVSGPILDAMAACPTGAIRWSESESGR